MSDDRPAAGECIWLEPGLRRVIAPNPSPMTHWGTNSYLVGEGVVALIDPGPMLPAHAAALLAALRPGERISHIIVTHAHLDHSPLAAVLAAATGAEVLAYGPAQAGRSAVMACVADVGGGEGVDAAFNPHRALPDGAMVEGPGWALEAIHTPGHFGNHICLGWGDRCFTGDHVMGWASSLVSPPDGDMSAYMASLARLMTRNWQVFHPGHGAPVSFPAVRLAELTTHRNAREAAILGALAAAPATLHGLTTALYTATEPALLSAASRNVFAHLIDLAARNRISATPTLSPSARFALV